MKEKYTLLIVDDAVMNIDMLTRTLGDKYAIMASVSGENAIRLMGRKTPDLVLLDISMPGIDGFGVLKFMLAEERLREIPVIFITGETDSFLEERGLELGAVDFIRKPYSAQVVLARVKHQIELKAYRDDMESLVRERTKQLESSAKRLEESTKRLSASREAIIMGMSLMSESHDHVTGEHLERIKIFTGILARELLQRQSGMITPELVEQTTLFSPLHDIGKISISDVILKKSDLLTPEEYEIMQSHTLEGAALLRKTAHFLTDTDNADDLKVAIEIAEFHHERYDGSGYPFGLKGDEIPICARIVAVADVYDALRSLRPYKMAFSHSETIDVIFGGDEKTSPAHFDPRLLEVLRRVEEEFKGVYDLFALQRGHEL